VIYCHPRALGESGSWLTIFAIEEGTMLKMKLRLGESSIVQLQDTSRLGCEAMSV
jgi:hypothetical protein